MSQQEVGRIYHLLLMITKMKALTIQELVLPKAPRMKGTHTILEPTQKWKPHGIIRHSLITSLKLKVCWCQNKKEKEQPLFHMVWLHYALQDYNNLIWFNSWFRLNFILFFIYFFQKKKKICCYFLSSIATWTLAILVSTLMCDLELRSFFS